MAAIIIQLIDHFLRLCNSENKQGIFRRKSSTSSIRSTLAPAKATSCPTSPRQCLRRPSRSCDQQSFSSSSPYNSSSTPPYQTTNLSSGGLHRSSSTISSYRHRSSPAGLYSYTAGSAPTSVHGSRVDLTNADKGSAIYLGCTPPKTSNFGGSTWSISKGVGSPGGSSMQTPLNTPPVSPKHMSKRVPRRK